MSMRIFGLLLGLSVLPLMTAAAEFTVNAMTNADCVADWNDQRFWSGSEIEGQENDAQTVSCIVGFPSHKDDEARISLNGFKVTVFERSVMDAGDGLRVVTYSSLDEKIMIQIKETEIESNCGEEGMEEKCCGGYTSAVLIVSFDKASKTFRINKYQGG
ncbi:MAG: hypothetical protein Q8J78_15945 [Moraxellaceae bacterium]|nr:hypothetical protein [Moraxellaceae bacterium]